MSYNIGQIQQMSPIAPDNLHQYLFTFTHPPSINPYIVSGNLSILSRDHRYLRHTKKQNGIDTMKEPTKRKKLKEFRKHAKTINKKLKDDISRAEAKLLLHTLLYHFNGFARQQQLVNEYMSSKYHWGNKRTARVLKTLSEIDIIERSRPGSDNWTLFFLVKGFIDKCKDRIERALQAIRKRSYHFRSAILWISLTGKSDAGPRTSY